MNSTQINQITFGELPFAGAILSHDNMTYTSRLSVTDNLGRRSPGSDRILSFLPPSHVIALVSDGFIAINVGAQVTTREGEN